MRYTILFIITLVVVSGFIAYIGDFLGRKMGKKRLTMFGMRPRHTAIIVTTITGMVIAIATLAAVIGISSSIREVLVAGEQKIAQNKVLTKQNKVLQDTNERLKIKEDALRKNWEAAKANVEEAKKARDEAAAKVTQLSGLISAHIKDLNDLRKKKNLTEAQLADKIKVLRDLERELRSVQGELAKTNEKLASAQKELKNAERIVSEQLATIADQERTIAKYYETIQDQERKEASLRQEKRLLGQQNLQLGSWLSDLRTGKFILSQGQELMRSVVSQNQSPLSIRGDILSILEEASDKAKEFGAKVGPNDRAVLLIAPGVTVNETECINAATESIAKSHTPVLVQVIVAENTVAGKQTVVAFQLYRNDLAFSKGTRIASADIDGRQPEGKILLSVVNFLKRDVRKAADQAGVVPVASPEPDIQGDQLDELMELVSKIKQVNSKVNLRVSAEKDIYSADPLNLNNLEFTISTRIAKAPEREHR